MPTVARCGRADEIPAGGSKVVQIGDRRIAIFHFEERFYALDDTCPHQGGPLGEGYLEAGGVVSCPWHAWTFDLKTGISPIDKDVAVACHPVRVENGQLIVEIA